MNIALVCKNFVESKGGLERYAIFLGRELLRLGHEVHVFCHRRREEPGIRFHHVPILRLSSPLKNLSFAYFTRKALAGRRFDVIQSMERVLNQDIFRASDGINPIQMMERYPNPVVRKMKAMGPRRQALTFLEKRIFEKNGCRYVMTNSRLVKDQILDHYQIPPERISVLYNSVDHDRFNPSVREEHRASLRKEIGVDDNDFLLLFVGNDFKRKGLPLLKEAMVRSKNPQMKLMVAGSDKTGTHHRPTKERSSDRRIFFLGPRRNIERCYGAADLLVLPTRYDAFANVCLEAMACGIPVITTRTNGACEIIENGVHGYVLDTRDSEELAARIDQCSHPEDLRRMGHHAFEKAAGFTRERYIAELMELYERVRIQKSRE